MLPLCLSGARTLLDGVLHDGARIVLSDGRIAEINPAYIVGAKEQKLPAGSVLAPGFIDAQVNGGGGAMFNDAPDAATALAIAAAHRRLGTTGIMVTLITDTDTKMRAACAAAPDAVAQPGGGVLGLHFEGPWLNPARAGVHLASAIRAPDPGMVEALAALAATLPGPVMVTLAPEMVEDATLRRLAAAGIVLCAGHTEAAPERMAAAATCGLRGVTHLFNAMPPLAARAPGPAAAALTHPGLHAGIIADGVHVQPAMLRLALACLPERLFLVSDAMAVAGTDLPGFTLQGRPIARAAGRLVTAKGTLAGADLDMAGAVRHLVNKLGVAPARALSMASTVPADFLGLAPDRGRIAVGARADLVLLDATLHVLGTWVDGLWQAAP